MFSGHDWGSMVVWELGRLHPDRVAAIYNMSVPYSQRRRPAHGDLRAPLRGQVLLHALLPGRRAGRGRVRGRPAALGAHHALLGQRRGDGRTPTRLCVDAPRQGTKFLDILTPPPETLPAWLSEEDIDVYVEGLGRGGLFGPVSFYRNMDANWERSKDIAPSVYTMPAGFITGSLDPVNLMMPGAAEAMAEALPDFRGSTVVDGAGHWVQQEKPAETNAALLAFLASRVQRARCALPAQPGGVPWPTEDWPEGPRAGGRRRWRRCSTRSSTPTARSPPPTPWWWSRAAG